LRHGHDPGNVTVWQDCLPETPSFCPGGVTAGAFFVGLVAACQPFPIRRSTAPSHATKPSKIRDVNINADCAESRR